MSLKKCDKCNGCGYICTTCDGKGYINDFVYNSNPKVDNNNMILLGWVYKDSGESKTWQACYIDADTKDILFFNTWPCPDCGGEEDNEDDDDEQTLT